MSSEAPTKGKLLVVSAPSGSGKTTIARAILARWPEMAFSVSATTRPKRAGEVDGQDYQFLSREEFARRVEAGEFVEWEEIYGEYYGTLKRDVDRALASGRHLLFDVDVKGALSIQRCYPEAVLIFIRPPSLEVLMQRLRDRRTEDPETQRRRMERVPLELELGARFGHHVVNDVLDRAIQEVETIVRQYIHHS